jgi:hypothetical protein
MRMRAGLVAVLLLAALAPESLAAKQVCRIVQDARGDAHYPVNLASGVPGDGADDLISADLAGDGTALTFVWRLAALRVTNQSAPMGQRFVTHFNAPGTQRTLFVSAATAPSGAEFAYGYVDPGALSAQLHELGRGKGVLDPARSEVRVTAPARGFSATDARLARGAKLRSVTVMVSRVLVPGVDNASLGPTDLIFDEADGSAYVVGTPSCARPVR